MLYLVVWCYCARDGQPSIPIRQPGISSQTRSAANKVSIRATIMFSNISLSLYIYI